MVAQISDDVTTWVAALDNNQVVRFLGCGPGEVDGLARSYARRSSDFKVRDGGRVGALYGGNECSDGNEGGCEEHGRLLIRGGG